MKTFKTHINLAISLIAYILISFISFNAKSQNEWTWIKGNLGLAHKGIYGTQGVPSANNTPGVRFDALHWTDLNGNLWLYGGNGVDSMDLSGELSDLWKFDITLYQWVWVNGSPFIQHCLNGVSDNVGHIVFGTKGIASPSNTPGFRGGSATWTDNNGDLWLFGGSSLDTIGGTCGSSIRNDLWKYNISTNMWTWINGSKTFDDVANYGTKGAFNTSNIPGSRVTTITWKDANDNLWLFGGDGVTNTSTSGYLNDLWKYNIALGQWVWIHGGNSINGAPSYGNVGVSSPTNVPGARVLSFKWVDKNGNFWMFGGNGYDVNNNFGTLNDLWKYNPLSNQWVWMIGSNLKNQLPIYGTQNIFAASNRPGAMVGGACWADSIGNLWIGNCVSTNQVNTGFYTNIMWKYNPNTNQWSWAKGPNVLSDQIGNYGIKGVSNITNIPAGRIRCNYWTGKDGEFWLFSGFGHPNNNLSTVSFNDLWRFIPCYTATVTPSNASVSQTICSGSSATISAYGNGAITWYDINSNVLATGNNYTTPTLTTNTTFLVNDNVSCLPISITISVSPIPTITISASSTVVCQSNSVTLNALSGAFTYTWNNGSNATSIVVNPTITTTYTVSASNFPTGCTNSAIKTISVNPLPTINTITNNTMLCVGQTATISASGANTYTWNTGMNGISITVSPTTSTTYSVNGTDLNGCKNSSTITQSVNVCTGIELLNQPTNIYIYPNPTNELVNIDLGMLNLKSIQIELLNTLGEILINKNINTQYSSIVMKDLPIGIYFIKIIQNNRLINYYKVIKEN